MNVSHLAIGMLNATWQSVAIIGAAALGLRLCRKVSAPVRCALWSSVFFLSALLPVADLAMQRTLVVPAAAQHRTIDRRVRLVAVQFDRAPSRQRSHAAAPVPAPETVVVRVPAAAPLRLPPPNPVVAPARAWQDAGGAVLALYALGAAFFLIRLGVDSIALLRLKRRARPFDAVAFGIGELPRGARLATSADVSIPCVLGLGRPLIVLPDDMPRDLSAADLRRVVAHESAHVERCDDWANLFEQIVLAAFYYNPAMHFAARQIATEREIACDDSVVLHEGETLTYAECLAALVRRTAAPRRVPVPGLYAGPRQIVVRMERLLDRAYVRSRRLGGGIVATAAALLALAVAVVGFDVPVIADPVTPKLAPAKASPVARAQAKAAVAAPAIALAHQKHVSSSKSVVALAPQRRSANVVAQATAPPEPPALAPAPASSAAPQPSVPPLPAEAPWPMPSVPAMPSMPPMPTQAQMRQLHVMVERLKMAPMPPMGSTVHVWRMDGSGHIEVYRSGPRGSMLDALAAAGYPKLSVDDLIRLAGSGVTSQSIVGFGKLFGHPSVDQLKRLADAGVTPSYVERVRVAGLANLSVDDAIALANAGVSSMEVERYVRALSSPPSVKDIIRLHNSGVQ